MLYPAYIFGFLAPVTVKDTHIRQNIGNIKSDIKNVPSSIFLPSHINDDFIAS